MRRSPNMNSPVQKGDRHARVAEPIPRPMVLQIPRGMGTEVSEAGDLRPDATWDWENRSGTMSAARRGVDRGSPLSDHVHVLLGIPPKFSVANTVGFLKGKSAIRIHREYLGRQRNFTGYHFWARGYCVSTVGLAEEVIREYIRKQEEDEKKQEKLELG